MDIGKFYRARNGDKAVCIAEIASFYHMAYLGRGAIDLDSVSDKGIASTSDNDIVGEWVQRTVYYINFYNNGSYFRHLNREEADKYAGDNRLSCVRVEFQKGQFDD